MKNLLVIIILLFLLSFLGSAVTSCSADWISNNWLDNIVGWFKKDNDKKEEENGESVTDESTSLSVDEILQIC